MIKVLMLGWEFPPIVSGGLGVATYGMVKSLRSHVSIKLIVPTSDPSQYLDNVDIIGLNHITSQQLSTEYEQFTLSHLINEIEKIPLSISPYPPLHQVIINRQSVKEQQNQSSGTTPHKKIQTFFDDREVYGKNLLRKVYLFAEMADQLASESDFDIIHCHDWVTYPAGMKISQRTGKPLVVHVHALETDRAGALLQNETYWLEKTAMDQADKILSVSHYTRQQIIQHYHVEPSKIEVVHNGIEPKQVTRKKNNLNDKLVAFLGRITLQKGPQFLLETAEKITKVYPRVKFIVAGTGDEFTHLLENTAYKKLGRKFIFTGFLPKEKVEELLAIADVYFMPSISEPFGLTALEAAQHYVPGVLSKQSGAGEVITASLQADYWDTDKYANYIYALLKYDTLHKELSAKANQETHALTWDHAANKIVAHYKKLLSRPVKQSSGYNIN